MRALRLLAAVVLTLLVTQATADLSGATFTSTTHSATSTVSAAVDWTAPELTLTIPDSPLSGTVQIDVSATDPEGSATTIRLEVSPAGAGQWSQVCTSDTSPVSCYWDTTTVPDGMYDIRATATDSSGNANEQTIVDVAVDNTP